MLLADNRPRNLAKEQRLTHSNTRDVVIVGGGPAGSIAARLLGEQGHDVLLFEEHEAIGAPVHCTGLMGDEAFDQFDLPREAILGEARTARFSGATGRSVAVRSDRIRAVVIDRAQFDARLAVNAQRAGAEIRRGHRVDAITIEKSAVRVATHRQTVVHARACVLACGARYRFHRALGLGLPDMYLQSAQLETAFPPLPEIEVRFGREVATSGFAWLVPVWREGGPHARIGLMSATRARQQFAAFLEYVCVRAGINWTAMPPPRLKMLPLGPVSKTYADRVVAIGDAAGLVKPTTGGGIHYGLLSGVLAADVLNDALRRDRLDQGNLLRYERLWRRRLGQEIRVGRAFRKIAARLSDESIDQIIELARVNGVIPLLQEKASFNWHRKAAVALLGHPAFRRIVYRTFSARDGFI